jgi:tetratricopeptide (TPR) repeat protein
MFRIKFGGLLLVGVCIVALAVVGAAQDKCEATDYDCQVTLNTALIAKDAGDVEAYYNRALAYRRLEKWALAVKDLDKYLTFKIDNKEYLADGYSERSWSRHKLDDRLGAIADLTKAIEVEPTRHECYYNRGVIYNELKSYAKAIPDFSKYIEMNAAKPEFIADGYHGRGNAYNGILKFEMAVADLTKAIEIFPAKAVFYRSRAFAYRKLGKIVLAQADEAKVAELEG